MQREKRNHEKPGARTNTAESTALISGCGIDNRLEAIEPKAAPADRHAHDIDDADDNVLSPVKQQNIEDPPAEKQNAGDWQQIDQYQDDRGRSDIQISGNGMKSSSPGTFSKRPSRQLSFACSIRSRLLLTKFHQICRSPTSVSPPHTIT